MTTILNRRRGDQRILNSQFSILNPNRIESKPDARRVLAQFPRGATTRERRSARTILGG